MAAGNRGVALVLTLFVMLALILLAGGVAMMSGTETRISRNYGDAIRCRWAARAGVYGALQQLKTMVQDQTTYLGEDKYTVSSDGLSVDLGGCTFESVIEDEAGKVNINSASPEVLTALFDSSEIADCIIDWRNANETARAQGAETDYYSSLPTPYRSKNADFETVRELMLVKGITEDTLSAPPPQGSRPLTDLLTVYEPKSPIQAGGSRNVDIQSGSRQNLRSALGDVLNSSAIDAIITYRSRHTFRSPAEIIRVPGISRSQVGQIYGRLRVSGASTKPGLVNINTAPVEVLTVQPGLDAATAQGIIDYRAQNGAFDNVGALLAVTDVSDDAFVNAAPYLEVRSNVFKIAATGHLTSTGASATITCIAEVGSDGTAQIRYWQE